MSLSGQTDDKIRGSKISNAPENSTFAMHLKLRTECEEVYREVGGSKAGVG